MSISENLESIGAEKVNGLRVSMVNGLRVSFQIRTLTLSYKVNGLSVKVAASIRRRLVEAFLLRRMEA